MIAADKGMFERYLYNSVKDCIDPEDCYYLWTYKGTSRPFALLHKKTYQFKDVHNNGMNYKDDKYNPAILDGLIHISEPGLDRDSFIHEGDFMGYNEAILKYLKKDKPLGQYCCEEWWKGLATYDPKTNTVDCHNNKILFHDECLNNEQTFDFKLINLNTDLSFMFSEAYNLNKLPDDFIIPEQTTNCESMFNECCELTELPSNFKIPKNVKNCKRMFENCNNLLHLPLNFKIENINLILNHGEGLEDMFKSTEIDIDEIINMLKYSYGVDTNNEDEDVLQLIEDTAEQMTDYFG